ncbi:MAG: hypothetical protein CMK89_21190 [Pseudomonadales bacterium]|nr:hypothetical protein [Pseudomonadales bacterium]
MARRRISSGSELEEKIAYLLPDRDDFERCWPVLRQWLGDVRPAGTMFEARLMNDQMKIEIQVTARLNER